MNTFSELSIILAVATVVAVAAKLLRQPLIIGHIITGLIVGPYALNLIETPDTLRVFSELGVALLLFIVGLQLSPRVIREVGRVSLVTGIGQVVFTTGIGYLILHGVLGFSPIESLYIALALTFSSTIIILKLLSDKGDLQKLYSKISIGFLLVQDIIAVCVLIVLGSAHKGLQTGEILVLLFLKGILFFAVLAAISAFILPKLSVFFAKSQELLFLFSAAWGLGFATLFYLSGFSLEVGALASGVALSVTPYNYEISAKLRPLRDFFIILFFVLLGSQLAIGDISSLWFPAIILSLFVLIGNPLVVIALMGALGYSKKTGFLSGLTVAQISEFSLILIIAGINSGNLPPHILSLITMVGIITIAGSSYLILYGDKIYPYMERYLSIFERKRNIKDLKIPKSVSVILFGSNRVGYDFISLYSKMKKKFLVVDFDPVVIAHLRKNNINCVYGDVEDAEFLSTLPLREIRMAVTSVADYETDFFLLQTIRACNPSAILIAIAHSVKEAEGLYASGASYVIMPHFLGAKYAVELIEQFGFRSRAYSKERERHRTFLEDRKKLSSGGALPSFHFASG